MRLDLPKGTRDYQYHPDGPTARQAAPVSGLVGIEKFELLPSLLPRAGRYSEISTNTLKEMVDAEGFEPTTR